MMIFSIFISLRGKETTQQFLGSTAGHLLTFYDPFLVVCFLSFVDNNYGHL